MKRQAHVRTAPRRVPAIARLLGPMQHFIQQSESSGIILIGMTLVALVLANSPLSNLYEALLETHIAVAVGPFRIDESLLHWINDGLMAIFFFVVGLEIKREVLVGELANPRAAALPILAAIGGVLVPASIYIFVNGNGIGARGWGIPMATDIAFALGALALLGNRIPFALKIFLTAVAIVDDLIAVLVIAIFYSSALNFAALSIGLLLLGLLWVANVVGIRNKLFYAGMGLLIWLAFLQSGVHATIAGVLIACTIPARNRIDLPTFLQRAHQVLQRIAESPFEPSPMLTSEVQQSAVIRLEEICEDVQAPLQKMEYALQGWVALVIMPVFALSNAGVTLRADTLRAETLPIMLGIVLGLVVGKPIGLVGASWLAVRLKIAVLPAGVAWRHMIGAGVLGGIGFTMSLFIASLALVRPEALASAKISILIASLCAGTIGFLLLRNMRPLVQAIKEKVGEEN